MINVLEARTDGYSRYQRPGSSAEASTSSYPSRSNMNTTVREIRRTRPESHDAPPDSELPQAIPHAGQQSNINVTPIDTRAKTKAQIMREWRQSQGESNLTQARPLLTICMNCRSNPKRHRSIASRHAIPSAGNRWQIRSLCKEVSFRKAKRAQPVSGGPDYAEAGSER